ncbi:formate dehydrogenase accessory protein FdhE [Evansella sp. AB-P1]|uniref:formate dehydrogenase accessory protein FdhE n=1 Tax=Evansella sp. AB-P1 TaxID=3037653 RepID=UPI00241CFE68|nr:formate dehydrogenase accessory protein FdhE [Evansella sp. AB-P1]MDG5787817.1 formate dehydrogenase accessory protein FdhE [Evansella sp. AB-P1]
MESGIVSEDYLTLQYEMMEAQQKIKVNIEKNIELEIIEEELNFEKPVLPQLKQVPIPLPLFHEALLQIAHVLIEQNTLIENKLIDTLKQLKKEELVNWIKSSIMFDTEFFQSFSVKNDLEAWVPHFVAEQALRPFLHVVSEKCTTIIHKFDVMGTCPCCGEPPRLGKVDEGENKLLTCPRCETDWNQKKNACVHCGEDREGMLIYLGMEEDDSILLEVCKTCRNYLKLVEKEKDKKKSAALIDLETLPLDFVAQEEGYGDSN